jgi:DNA topoisomerase-1
MVNESVYAAEQLGACGASATETKRNIMAAIKAVAGLLGNRPATCRKYYVHPVVLELYVAGQLAESMTARSRSRNFAGLAPAECCLLQILLAKSLKPSRSLRLRAK